MCSIIGGGKNCEFFAFDWKSQLWNLVFALGLVLGGWVSHHYLMDTHEVVISSITVDELGALGFPSPGLSYAPEHIFSWHSLSTIRGLIIIIGGGFLVGFGARYAGGCTSGHAISGLSALQFPSLVAAISFFAGGLLMTYFLLPIILSL